MDTQLQPQPSESEVEAQGEEQSSGGGDDTENGVEEVEAEESEDERLLTRAAELMSKVTESRSNPNPKVLHALAAMLETEEQRYMEEFGYLTLDNSGRASHNIGKLGSVIRENDEFFELVSNTFLTESSYSTSVRSATARLLVSISSTWMYPHPFESTVLENLQRWIMEDTVSFSADDCQRNPDLRSLPTDAEMLRTYATGLLAISLTGEGKIVEEVLTSGLSAKFMCYLRVRVLGVDDMSQKDDSNQPDGKTKNGREGIRGMFRHDLDSLHVNSTKNGDSGLFGSHYNEKAQDKTHTAMLASVGNANNMDEGVNIYAGDGAKHIVKEEARLGDQCGIYKTERDANVDGSGRDDLSRRQANHGGSKARIKGRLNEGFVVASPGSGVRSGIHEVTRDSSLKIEEIKHTPDFTKNTHDDVVLETESHDDSFEEFKVGSRDISFYVKKAVRAAEAEARAANAPVEAVKAAGDAAADLVKSAALEVLTNTSDEEAAVLAASTAAGTVVSAAIAPEVSRNSVNFNDNTSAAVDAERNEEIEGFFVVDSETLALLREKYCIQCLEVLGEYVEVLGPVLQQKGVDVCLALLQITSKNTLDSKAVILLPDVLKLICALSAHRKFAAVFVDRGGMQKLLAVPRVNQTFFGLSSCLFTIGSLQGIMERVCALSSEVVHKVVELALEILECSQDLARKNAAVFFAAAFVFRAVVESFDAQEGLKKIMSLLGGAASVRSGGNSGTMGMPNLGSLRNNRSPAEVLTALEKQVAYHSCIALRQYFRAHLLLLVESLRPNKSSRSVSRNLPSSKAAYKPLDLGNEAIDSVFLQIQRDRKLGPAFVKSHWPTVGKFVEFDGHKIMLELLQAPPGERYLHDLGQYALGVLHIVTLVPFSRKAIVSATLSNNRVGMAVILDAANGAGNVDPEIIQPALNVLVNLVCPPPSISNKPPGLPQGQQSVPLQSSTMESTREKPVEKNPSERTTGESGAADRGTPAAATANSGMVGDRRISLGPRTGFTGVAAALEQGYHEAREAVRANNGIKVLLYLLHPRIFTAPAVLDCLRALACRVLLGLARDDAIAHNLTKLQVGKKLSELIRDTGSQAPASEQGKWQSELTQVAIELIAIVTNSGRASTLSATDAAAPTLKRFERAAIAAATPITYHSRDLLLLIHEHLHASGLNTAADALLKEAQLTPLPFLATPQSLLHQISVQETKHIQSQWPSGRTPCGFFSDTSKLTTAKAGVTHKSDIIPSKKQREVLSSHHGGQPRLSMKIMSNAPKTPSAFPVPEISVVSELRSKSDVEPQLRTPIVLGLKRKQMETKEYASSRKRIATSESSFLSPVCHTPSTVLKSSSTIDPIGLPSTPSSQCGGRLPPGGAVSDKYEDNRPCNMTPSTSQLGPQVESQHGNIEQRVTLDSLVVQYLKHQHRHCAAPITTLPPLSLLAPHSCPEPKRSLDLPSNVTSRLSSREFRFKYGGKYGNRKDRQFVYSRFRPWRTCRDENALLTSISFLGDFSQIVTGTHSGELKIFDSNSGNVLESYSGHNEPVNLIQSAISDGTKMLLSSSSYDVKLWDASAISAGHLRSFDGCKAGRFSNSGAIFAVLSTESPRQVLLYDVHTFNKERDMPEAPPVKLRVQPKGIMAQPIIHFSPDDNMLMWDGNLWDRRDARIVHSFEMYSDFGGGGFHPSGNEVILNSEVWDLRKFSLLRSVSSLDQTTIKFNTSGDIIYATLRRNLDDITAAASPRRAKHPLFTAFRTLDALNYTDIATIPVDRCVLDFATEKTETYVGVVYMDDHDEMYSSAKIYEIGRRRPTGDESDPDEVDSDDGDDSADDVDQLFEDLDGNLVDHDDMSSNEDDDEDDGDSVDGEIEFDATEALLEAITEAEDDEDDDDDIASYSSGDEGDYDDSFVF